MIWRHSSEPMDPPPPVTSTTRPRRIDATSLLSRRTGSRPSRSDTSTGRTFSTRQSTVSSTLSSRRISQPVDLHSVRMDRICSPVAVGMAMMIVSIALRATMSSNCAPVPSTGTPRTLRPTLDGSSSTRQTMRSAVSGESRMESISAAPAMPAP